MSRLILAAVSPDNTPHGYNWTFAFPMLLFIVIGIVLYFRLQPAAPAGSAPRAVGPGGRRRAGRSGGQVRGRRGRALRSAWRRHHRVAPGAQRRASGAQHGHVDPVDTEVADAAAR